MRFAQHIGVISHKTLYAWGGQYYAEGGFPRQMEALADLFRQVTICAPVREAKVLEGLESLSAKGLLIDPLPDVPVASVVNKLLFLFAVPYLMWRIWRFSQRVDIVQVRIPNYVGLLGATVMRASRKPTFVWLGGDWPRAIVARRDSPIRRRAAAILRWLIPRLLTGWPVFVPEPRTIEGCENYVNLAAVGNTSFWQHELPEHPRDRFPLGDRLALLFVGRLDPIKGAHVLLQALALIPDIPWHLTVVGDGEQRGDLTALAKRLGIHKQITFIGRVQRQSLPEYYQRSDIVVVPSLNEMAPKVLLEAMAYGAAVVASRVGAIPRLVGEQRGILVEPGDARQIAEAILRLYRNPQEARTFQRCGWELARNNTFEVLNQQMAQVLRELLGSVVVPDA